ncbi:hypothetical protein [Qipengyuania sediminis]|uniref:hypothetical protein n=1 Tax=Qipengyuania sediminis TaxID=1532023 RepID=UPI00140481E9|nr:hypothetical protein [Qipengyuania sediminis]
MDTTKKAAFPVVGVMFLALAVFNFVRGEHFVVWAILCVLFGGLGAFGWRKRSEG